MSETHLPARRYDDKEIARLLKRATELQAQEPHTPEHEGLTLRELEIIAREAGIDAGLLHQAAAELDRGPAQTGLGPLLAGEVVSLLLERTFEGELDASELEGLLPLVNIAADTTGNVSLVGHTLNFNGGGQQSSRAVQILISSRDGQTLVRVEERYGQLAGGLFGGIVGGGGVGFGVGMGAGVGTALGSTLFVVGIPLLVIGGTYGIARYAFKTIVGKRRKALTKLMDQVGAAVESRGRRALPEEGTSGS
jgi:hypothetical protein